MLLWPIAHLFCLGLLSCQAFKLKQSVEAGASQRHLNNKAYLKLQQHVQ